MQLPKKTVENTIYIDISLLKGLECGEIYSVKLGSGDTFKVIYLDDYIQLKYLYRGESTHLRININYTPVGYGKRRWFECSGCRKNTSRLYIVYGHFACRSCHDLTYLSSKYSGNELNYLAIKIRRLQRKLNFEGEIYDFPIYKPENMHWNTFGKLVTELRALQRERDNVWASQAVKHL